jgi:dTDP-4-dehydrorhamnose 3,5-epimerase
MFQAENILNITKNNMEIVETAIEGCFLIKNALFRDDRGYFFESFNHEKFSRLTGWSGPFVQDNQSESTYGVVRGLHFQEGEYAQAKLVRVLTGSIIDVVVDLRPESPSFEQVLSVPLDDKNEYQLFMPRGCAHGFSVLSPVAVFFYKCDNYYQKQAEAGIHPLDEELNIDWKIEKRDILLSEKDNKAESWLAYKHKIGM